MKKEIIEEALNLFASKGARFKLSDLATDLSISKKTSYKYFKSKEELLMDCVDEIFKSMHEEQTRIFNDQSIDDLTRLKSLVLAMPKDIHTINLNFLSELKNEYPNVYQNIRHHLETDWDETYALINECKEKGLIKDIDNRLLRLMYLACSEKIMELDLPNVIYNEVEESVVDIIINGIKK